MFKQVTRTFTIAFTMRSGSNAICDMLARNGLGSAGEWFQQPLVASGDESWLDAFVSLVEGNQLGGVFGSKMSHDHRAALDERLRRAIPGYSRLDNVLPGHRWVQLVRKDKVMQAISLCRAELSGRWAKMESSQTQSGEFEYDFLHVLSRLLIIQAGELAWELYFQQHGIEPLCIVYEDFFQDPDPQLRRLIDYLGGLPPGRGSLDLDSSFKIQRDETHSALHERFISDLVGVGESSFAKEIGLPLETWGHFFPERQWRSPSAVVE